MRFLLVILLASAVLFQSLSKVILVAQYEFNRETITAAYCVNKDKPALHCNGKCHLIKQIREEEKREPVPVNAKDKNEIQLFSGSEISFIFSARSSAAVHYIFRADSYQQPVFTILHPPPIG